MVQPNLSSHQKLEPFLLLSKSAKGVANCKLIIDALNAPGVYVFTELYEAPNVVEASQLPEVAPYYNLLRIFLYGTFNDYQQQKANLPALTELQTKKLLQLTLVTLSESSQTLSYEILQRELNIPTVRELEDLIMDAMYNGLVTGKLDQRQRQLQVMKTIGRDLGPYQLDETMEALRAWSTQTSRLLGLLDAKIDYLKESVRDNEQAKLDYGHQLEEVRKEIRENTKNNITLPNEILQMDETSQKKARDIYNIRQSRGPKRLMVEKS
ncbi:hypothetical protein G6F37_008725 [Rhizopus arrhizus]|nr:hypothetical protein G6F38_008808 [Rhizopus arrhizus]KAG1155240.1 hypothetical protein G6F37_008725 [Rhizopus arrhizus]